MYTGIILPWLTSFGFSDKLKINQFSDKLKNGLVKQATSENLEEQFQYYMLIGREQKELKHKEYNGDIFTDFHNLYPSTTTLLFPQTPTVPPV